MAKKTKNPIVTTVSAPVEHNSSAPIETKLSIEELQAKQLEAANKLKVEREKALQEKGLAAQRAQQEKALLAARLEEHKAKERELDNDYSSFKAVIDDTIAYQSDSSGIESKEITRLFLLGNACHKALWQAVDNLPLQLAIERLNAAYTMLRDDQDKKSFQKKISNMVTPSNVGKRFTLTNHVGKIGFSGKTLFKDISDQDNTHKAIGGIKSGESKSAAKPAPVLQETTNTPEQALSKIHAKNEEQKLGTALSTVVRDVPDIMPVDEQNRFIASIIVAASDNLDNKHLVQLVAELNKLIAERTIEVKKDGTNG